MGIRYRVGLDRVTLQPLVGWPHCQQSVQMILKTAVGARVMRLEFGSKQISGIGRNLVPPVVLDLYVDAVTAVHRQETEYRIRSIQLVSVSRTGSLALRTRGLYYPEGRLGNYDLVEAADGSFVIAASQAANREVAA
jgi:phage baseplate assembly protein W